MIWSPESWWQSASSSSTSWASKSIAWPSPFLGSITARRHFPWVFPRSTSNPFHLHHIILFIFIYPEIYGDTFLQLLRNQFIKIICYGREDMIVLQISVNSRLVFQLVFQLVFEVVQSMVSRQSNLYNYTPLPRSLSSSVSFINRVFVGHIFDHARSIFSLFLPPACTFLYCSSTEQPSRATMLSPFQWKS